MRTAGGAQKLVEHFGSAADEASIALLVADAQRRKAEILGSEQQTLDLPGLPTPAEASAGQSHPGAARMAGTVARVLYQTLGGVYDKIGFSTVVDSQVFKKLVIARLVEPSSKRRAIEVLNSLGIDGVPSYSTVKRHLQRAIDEDWRDAVCRAAYQFATTDGPVSLCLYDATTLYFEADEEDTYRRRGFSKERRVDPQIVVGLLVDRTGFPLEVHSHPGNTAEATTIIPVLESFKTRHGIEDIVVVADAGMLSQANCEALQDAGYQFIIASKVGKMPKGLKAHLEAVGDPVENGWTTSISEKLRTNSTKQWRTVYHFSWKRYYRDQQNLNKQIFRAQDIAAGKRAIAKARFVTIQGKDIGINEADIERAKKLLGIKGYVTSAAETMLSNQEVVAHYHAIFEVEASFRLAKHDLEARPIFHQHKDMIEAHLTLVFTALAIARHMQSATGLSLRRILDQLRPLQDGIIHTSGNRFLVPAQLTDEAQQILQALGLDELTH